MSGRVAVIYLLSTRLRLRIAIARKKYWSSLTRLQPLHSAALLDAERRLGSTLPANHHHGFTEASNARRMLLRQNANIIDRR